MKKFLSLLLVVALTATAAVGGTLAYLTDRDSEVNVYTVGNVEIDLTESFRQGATLIPGVDIEKKPIITNTGDNDAWVWLTFSIPSALDNYVQGTQAGSDKNVIHWNPLGATTDGYVNETRVNNAIAAGHLAADITAEKILADKMTWNVFNSIDAGQNAYQETIDGVGYNTYVLLYNKALAPNESTLPNIYKVFLDANVDIAPNGDWYHVEGGVADKLDWNTEANGNPVIYVSAYAIQKDKFDSVDAAYAAYKDQWGDKGTEYASAVNSKADLAKVVTAATNDDGSKEYSITGNAALVDMALFSDYTAANPYIVNGNGATITGVATSADVFTWSNNATIPAMSNIFSSEEGEKVTVNDLTFTGTMSAIMAGNYVNSSSNWFKTEFNNVDIVDAEVVSFSAGVSPALVVYGNMTMNNCNAYGTTLSSLDTDPMWPVYDVAAVNYSDLTVNNSKIGSIFMWNQAKVTIADGSEVDTIVVRGNMNTAKYGLTVKAGAAVDAIDLSAVTNKAKVNITIEDGASVNKIVADGVEYASVAEWQAAQ